MPPPQAGGGLSGLFVHFADFWDLERVELPNSLKYIGRGAFETNTYLDKVVIPDGVEWVRNGAFQGCTWMREIQLGTGVGHIGEAAFARCSQLATVRIPDSVVEMGDGVFMNCWQLLSVHLPLGLEVAGVEMFAGCNSLTEVTMPTHNFTAACLFEERFGALESVEVVGGETLVCAETFKGCSALKEMLLPDSLIEIGAEAFANCRSLERMVLPDGLMRVGDGAFAGCSSLARMELPDSVAELGAGTFRDCTELQRVSLSQGMGMVPDYAFAGCEKLALMVVPASVTNLGKGIGEWFSGVYFLGNAPEYDVEAYSPRATNVTTYVVQGTRGWDGIPSSRVLPESWLGYPIAFWETNRYAVRFDANGGTGEMDNQSFFLGEEQELSACKFTLDGFRFIGWGTAPGGEVVYVDEEKVVDLADMGGLTVVLYAIWEKSKDEALPEIDSDSEVAEVMAEAVDKRLAEKIQTIVDYAAFREWALSVKGRDGEVAGAEAVMASEHAWASYLLGAATLFENEPEIRLEGIAMGTAGSRVASSSMQIRVTVKDSENAASVDADKVAALFEATRQINDWTEASLLPLSVTAKGTDGETLLFVVTPTEEAASSAFLRLGE